MISCLALPACALWWSILHAPFPLSCLHFPFSHLLAINGLFCPFRSFHSHMFIYGVVANTAISSSWYWYNEINLVLPLLLPTTVVRCVPCIFLRYRLTNLLFLVFFFGWIVHIETTSLWPPVLRHWPLVQQFFKWRSCFQLVRTLFPFSHLLSILSILAFLVWLSF
jgi:hypothetical protein